MAETSNRAGEVGKIVQIIGAVVDVEFPEGHIPELYDALQVKGDGKNRQDLILEVQQQRKICRHGRLIVIMQNV